MPKELIDAGIGAIALFVLYKVMESVFTWLREDKKGDGAQFSEQVSLQKQQLALQEQNNKLANDLMARQMSFSEEQAKRLDTMTSRQMDLEAMHKEMMLIQKTSADNYLALTETIQGVMLSLPEVIARNSESTLQLIRQRSDELTREILAAISKSPNAEDIKAQFKAQTEELEARLNEVAGRAQTLLTIAETTLAAIEKLRSDSGRVIRLEEPVG